MTSSTPAVNIVPAEGGFAVTVDGQDVLFYQREIKRFDEAHSRSHYIHPQALKGRISESANQP